MKRHTTGMHVDEKRAMLCKLTLQGMDQAAEHIASMYSMVTFNPPAESELTAVKLNDDQQTKTMGNHLRRCGTHG